MIVYSSHRLDRHFKQNLELHGSQVIEWHDSDAFRKSKRLLAYNKCTREKLSTIEEYKPDYYLKIVLLGDTGTSKTTFSNTFNCQACRTNSRNKFTRTIPRNVEYVDRVIEVSDKHVLARLYDTAGQEKFRSLTASYYRGALGGLVLFDVTKETTFDHVTYWLHDLKEYATVSQISAVLIGVKRDHMTPEARQVSSERASKYAESEGIPYMEICVNDSNSVTDAVSKLADLVLNTLNKEKTLSFDCNNVSVKVQETQMPKKQLCSC